MKSLENRLIFADSEHDADMLYAVGMFVPDPFIYLRLRGRNYVVMSDLEIDRARRQAPHCRALSYAACQKQVRKHGGTKAGAAEVIREILRGRKVGSVLVPDSFPFRLADELGKLGIRVRLKQGAFFPQREQKSPVEVRKIAVALRMAEAGMAAGVQALKSSRIGKDRRLMYRGAVLTSERLRRVIDTAVLQASGLANHTIVAGGRQGCDPHETGHGPLRANEPIILDIFPRSQETGYFGDITRTVVRGRASEAVRRLYAAVFAGQQLGLEQVRSGVPTQEVHRKIQELFNRAGYKTGIRNGRMEGFFHGTGHGLGLEIHEAPRLGSTSTGTLRPGHVVTVEPGLYYPELGGVRLEDVVVVNRRGCGNLTRFEKMLEV